MNENEYIANKLHPSLIKEAKKIEGAKEVWESGDDLGYPAALVHMEDGNYVISCIPAGDDRETFIYRIAFPGDKVWEFPEVVPPGELKVFPYLIKLYDAILAGEDIQAEETFHRVYEEVRLSSLAAALSSLGVVTAVSETGSGRKCLVMIEDEEEVLFSYWPVMPSKDICLLVVEGGGKRSYIPEMGEVKYPEDYMAIFESLNE